MKSLIIIISIAMMLAGCMPEDKVIDGKYYSTYGIFNRNAREDPAIIYEPSPWAMVWSVVFIETVIIPIYFIGWDLWEPVKKK